MPFSPSWLCWEGKTVAIMASGPSMTKEQADAAAKVKRIAINDTYLLAPDADVLYAADPEWWFQNHDALLFNGMKITAKDVYGLPGVHYCKPLHVSVGGNSALRAAHIAYEAGAERIILLGVDLNDDEQTHWHGLHAAPLRNPTPAVFRSARVAWEAASRSLMGGKIVNCSSRSSLTCFPKMSLEEALS